MRFFGVWAEPQAALDRYRAVAADLHAGRQPRQENVSDSELTVKDACNAFLNWQKDKLDAGEIGVRWFEDCRSVLTEFARAVGKERVVLDLLATGFQRHRTRLAKRLGINGGFGNTDCATLPRSALDLESGAISCARPKTGAKRVVPLWPETITAIREVLANRPTPENENATRLVLLSPRGKPLVRQKMKQDDAGVIKTANIDKLSDDFIALLKSLELKRPRVAFYTLRHTFRTWADETHDQHAIHRIMGHSLPGMSGIYVEEISLDRLRKVVEHVRGRLWN